MSIPTKHLLSTILLLLLSDKLHAQTFNTVGCGKEKGCFASPASCTTSENCNFLVTYNATNSNKMEFELSGIGDWIAVGFSNDQNMADTDIIMCVSNQAQSGHYYATGQTTPVMTNPTPAAITIVSQADEGGVIKCRISRDINPNPAIQNFRDLNQEVFLLAAVGVVTGQSTLERHSTRRSSPNKVSVTQANSTVTTESQSPTQQGSFRFPDSCQTSTDCDFLVSYQLASGQDKLIFELSGKNSWAGVGFSDDNQMPDTDMLICVSDQAQSGHYYATGRTKPSITNPIPAAVEIIEHSFEGGVVKCTISREINPGGNNLRDLNQDLFLLGAIGGLNGNSIGIHSSRQASSSRIGVTKAGVATGGSGLTTMILAHAILMTLAWLLFAFVGLITARYMRQVWEPRELLGNKAWFTVHRTLMTITVLLTITATIVIFVEIGGWSSGAGQHPYWGIVAIAFALVQPIMAAFRPHPGAPRRNIFNWTHRIVGFTTFIIAVIAIYFGLDTPKLNESKPNIAKQGMWAVIAFYIGEFLIFLFALYLIFSKRNKETRSVSMANAGDIPMQQPGHQTPPPPEMSIKEAMLRTMMFIFTVLLGASVSLTIILLLVF